MFDVHTGQHQHSTTHKNRIGTFFSLPVTVAATGLSGACNLSFALIEKISNYIVSWVESRIYSKRTGNVICIYWPSTTPHACIVASITYLMRLRCISLCVCLCVSVYDTETKRYRMRALHKYLHTKYGRLYTQNVRKMFIMKVVVVVVRGCYWLGWCRYVMLFLLMMWCFCLFLFLFRVIWLYMAVDQNIVSHVCVCDTFTFHTHQETLRA